MTEKNETNHKAPKFNGINSFRITKFWNIFSKGYTENWPKETFLTDSALKTNPWTCEIKYLNREKIIGSFYVKELLLSKL